MTNKRLFLVLFLLLVLTALGLASSQHKIAHAQAGTDVATSAPTEAAEGTGAARPVDLVFYRENEALTIYIAVKDVVSLNALTIEAAAGQGARLKVRLDSFPALQGLDMTRIVGPACFYIISNQNKSTLPLKCRDIPTSHLITQPLSPANMIWWDSVAQEGRLFTVTDGTNTFGECPPTGDQCEITYTAPSVSVPVTTPGAVVPDVIPITGQATVKQKTNFLTGPGPQYDVLAVVTGGTYAITGKTADGSYYRLNYNGQDAWVSAYSQTVTFDVVDVPTAAGPASPPLDATLTYGVTVEGKLDRGQKTNYRLVGIAGEVISIVVAGEFDSVLQLLDPQGNMLAEDDNSGGNPRIDNVKLLHNGEYRVVLRGYLASDSGTFTLTVYKGSAPPPKTDNRIKYGQKITGNLAPNAEAVYVFDGQKGDVISIVIRATFSSYLQLQDSDKNVVTSDDGSGLEGNPLIDLFELPADGQYRIVLRGVNPDDAGTYSINLLKSVSGNMVAIKPGTPVTSALQQGGQVTFTFDAAAGDRVTITVDAKFNTHLSLRDDHGAEVASDGDGTSQAALMDIALPAKGTYYIVVTGGTASAQGSFTLTLTKR